MERKDEVSHIFPDLHAGPTAEVGLCLVCVNLQASGPCWKLPQRHDFKVLNNDSEDEQTLWNPPGAAQSSFISLRIMKK